MLVHATTFSEGDLPAGTQFLAEETLNSTVENMVNSKRMLTPEEGELKVLGVLSDERHFSRGRIQYLGGLIFPDASVVSYQIANAHEPTPEEITEENLTNMMTRLVMSGVTLGNDRAIMRRQHALEKGNAAFRRLISLRKTGSITFSTASSN
jgi:hypothetical protein